MASHLGRARMGALIAVLTVFLGACLPSTGIISPTAGAPTVDRTSAPTKSSPPGQGKKGSPTTTTTAAPTTTTTAAPTTTTTTAAPTTTTTTAPTTTTTTAAPPASPWTLVQSDDFAGTAPSSQWAVLNGNQSPHWWSASRVSVHDGMMTLTTDYNPATGHWESGAVVLRGSSMLYGKVTVRMRCSAGYSKCVSLLWPDLKIWPPEVDFYEIFAADYSRTTSKQSLHYGPQGATTAHTATQKTDFTQWHTIGVAWEPGKISYLLDDVVTATMTQDLPTISMHLGIQTSVSTDPGAPQPTGPVHMDLDWVKRYDYVP